MRHKGTSPPLALTMGEPAGVGGEIMLKAWLVRSGRLPPFFAIDDPERLRRLADRLGLAVPVHELGEPEEARSVFATALPVLSQRLAAPAVPGVPEPANAPAVIAAIDRAVALAREGRAAAVVTNPVHKKTLAEVGFPHPGHTEYLAALAGGHTRPVMMLTCPGLRAVPVTVHLPLRKAVASLSAEAVDHCGRVTWAALKQDFGIHEPRLAVAALNPHAGEDGTLGREEELIIRPAVEALRAEGIEVERPLPADSLFRPSTRRAFDAVLCMYHDQALIPVKMLDFERGVNVTLGLPFVRTSPDHGTALDLAGKGKAFATSLVAALKLAAEMARRRRARG
ncbi:MAG: 4-hydroxythreonine-4-phosphate dehydrogenase PdxA [Alphaproteobacteria bacterium]